MCQGVELCGEDPSLTHWLSQKATGKFVCALLWMMHVNVAFTVGGCANVSGQMTAGKGRSNPGHMCMDLANTGMPEVIVEDHSEVYHGWA